MPRRNRNSGTSPTDPATFASDLAVLAASLGIPSQASSVIVPAPAAKAVSP
jgi:hypothetical protein